MLHGEGHGVIMAGESDLAGYTGEGVGRLTSSGTIWHGAIFYRTSSTGKLSFLNDVVGLFEAEVDAEGNFSETSGNGSNRFLFSFLTRFTKFNSKNFRPNCFIHCLIARIQLNYCPKGMRVLFWS